MPPNFGQFTDIFRQMGISDPYNPSGVAAGLSAITGQELMPSMVASLTPGMMKGTQASTYQPFVEAGTQTLTQDLVESITGKTGIQKAGGFAGTSTYTGGVSQARDVYGQGASQLLGEVGKMKSSAMASVQDIIGSWRDVISKVKYK